MLPNLRPFSCFFTLTLLVLAAPLSLRAQSTTVGQGPQYPYQTIQSAIDAGFTSITVDPGTYNENIVLSTQASVTLTSSSGPATTIIDGGLNGPVVAFGEAAASTSTSPNSTISGFTIQHGIGGIVLSASPATITGNLILDNNCWGIASYNSSPSITNNTISGTKDPSGDCGGGGGSGILISGDRSGGSSGSEYPATVIGNIIENNVQSGLEEQANAGGAGIAVDGGTSLIENNLIHDNSAPGGSGGGINVFFSPGYSGRAITILQNVLYNNSAGCGGGGIATPASQNNGQINLLIANNTLVDNTGDDSARYTECQSVSQIYPAPASTSDSDADFSSGPGTVIVNNIITGDTADPSVNCSPLLTPSEVVQPLFDHNILYNAGGSFFGAFCIDVSAQYGNSTLPPNLDTSPTNLYHPLFPSPAIDKGNNSVLRYVTQIAGLNLTTDGAGVARVQDGTGLGYPVIDMGAYEYTPMGGGSMEVAPTTIVVTPSAYSGTAKTTFTVTATLAAGVQTPTGSVTFYVDGQPLPSSVLISSGIASITDLTFVPGVHNIYAVYAAQNGFAPAVSLPVIINIPLITTTLLFESESIPPPEPSESKSSFVGQPVLFTITVSAADGTVPTPVTITDNTTNTLITPTPLQPDSSGTATFTYTSGFSTIGPHYLVASYAGNKVYAPTSDPLTQIVTGYPTTVTLNCPTAIIPFGGTATILVTVSSPNGTPTGPIYLSDAGVAIDVPPVNLTNGSANIVYTATASGPQTILASYLATGAFAANSATCNLNVAQQNTLALTSSSPLVNGIPTSPAYSPITFTAVLNTTTSPTGRYSITLQSAAGSNTYSMSADAAGTTATYTTSSLAPGQYNVTADFSSYNNVNPVPPATLYPYQLVTVPTGDFTLTGPSTLTTTTEKSTSGALTLTSIDSFQGTVALTCNLPLPTTYTCAISPTSVPIAVGGTGSSTVTLSPSLNRAANDTASRIVFASLFPLTLISLAGFSRRRKLSALLPLAILAILAASTTACGKDISYPATPPGSYPFTITATGTTKGGAAPVTHTLNITLNLTP